MALRGKLILVIGPTGSGKSVLMNYVHERFADLVYATSCTTRERRPGNENTSYQFLTAEAFKERAEAGDFLEWAHYGENYYGTPKSEVTAALSQGKTLIKEMEVQGVRQVQEQLPGDVVLIYIDAGSWEELEKRVRARAPITDAELEKRRQRFEDEFPFRELADYVVENPPGKLEEAKEDFAEAISSIISSTRA
ncbi:MAG: guanylate kinase [Candidatus Pacebacteria bacterium]|nr:guanylate kinase [Candidatus Paceibacterota bacterium]